MGLTGDEQKVVKPTAFDLQLNPANLGMRFHKLYGLTDEEIKLVEDSAQK